MRPTILLAVFLSACADAPDYKVVGDKIPEPLTSEKPDPVNGKVIFETRSGAHCVLCHVHSRVNADFQGNLGPDLTEVQNRLSPAQIRLRIVDYDRVVPGTTMPSYFRKSDLQQVAADKKGQTVLTGLEIEDIIAFLTQDDFENE